MAALADSGHLERTLELTLRAGRELHAALAAIGARVNRSQTHFHLVEVGDGAAWRAQLLQHGLLVRNCASFGLPGCVRIGTRTPEDNKRLLKTWKEMDVVSR